MVPPTDHINYVFPSEMVKRPSMFKKVCMYNKPISNLYLKIITLKKINRFEESRIYFYDTISQELNPS